MTPDVLATALILVFSFFLLIYYIVTVGIIKRMRREHVRLLGLILDTKRMEKEIAELNTTVNLLVSESVFRSDNLNNISDQIKEKMQEESTTDEQAD